ncbi:MAG: hypothetical protein HY082_09620 [Gammaproteobacteria bacterium]|nr:hypothetical protein [Gammaproteobacteria bacterium]
MQDILMRLVDVPLARMFVLAAIIFLLVAVLGKIEGKIEPGKIGRIGATVVGILLMASGLAMHFIDAEELRDKLRGGVNPPLSAPRLAGDVLAGGTARDFPASSALVLQAVASQGGAGSADKAAAGDKAENVRSAIKVVAGTYGRHCGAKPGNATAQVARACDGQTVCQYKIDVATLEDTAPACAKDFTAEWKCGTAATVYAVTIPAGAMQGEHLRLACTAFQ